MRIIYFDAFAGASGDMILAALLDLGIPPTSFIKKMAELKLPAEIEVKEVNRSSLRGLKVDVLINSKKKAARKFSDIEALVQKSPFTAGIKKRALGIFRRLFEAESHVHGQTFEKAHLHEAGADDAIIDIVGACWLAEELDVHEFYASPLNLGRGWVKTSHGILPVPPPAVGELLKSIPVYSAHVEKELVTPTGAAILSSVVKTFLHFPELCYQRIGYGAGMEDFPGFPNILRAFLMDGSEFKSDKMIFQIEANIDDENPQVLAHFLENALQIGALDVFFTPVYMKKNRPATKLTILAELGKIDALVRAIFQETSTIGLRYYPVHRRVLERKVKKVHVLGEDIPLKVAYLERNEINIQPEFSFCQRVAKKNNRPLREIIRLALREYEKQRSFSKNHGEKDPEKKS